jgi:hypothetical protein
MTNITTAAISESDFRAMSGDELARWAVANGWDVAPASLFDEEAVEGWLWSKGDREMTCMADGADPVVDDPAKDLVVADLAGIVELCLPATDQGHRSPRP